MRLMIVYGAVVAAVLLEAPRLSGEDRNSEQFIRTVLEAYRSNRESFRQFSCRYRVTRGMADSKQAALNGNYQSEESWVGTWVVDQERGWERSSREAPVEAARKKLLQDAARGANEGRLPPSTEHFLDDTEIQLSYGALLNGSSMYGPGIAANDAASGGVTPFGMAMMGLGEKGNPARNISDGLAKDQTWTIENVDDGGRPLVRIARDGQSEPGDPAHQSYTFDPARGYLPAQIKQVSQEGSAVEGKPLTTEARVTDARRYPEAGWVPWRWVRTTSVETIETCAVLELRVLEFKYGRPDDSEFQITLPKGSFVNEASSGLTNFRLKKTNRIDPGDLRRLYERAMAALEQREADHRAKAERVAAIEEIESRGWWRKWLVIGSVLLIAAVGIVFGYRHYRSQNA